MAALGGSSAVELDTMYLQPNHVHRHSDVSDLEVVNEQQPSPGIEDQAGGRGSDHGSEIIPVGTLTGTSSEGSRSLRRELRSVHIFFLSISTCIGLGFYVRTGNMDYLGGQGAAIYAYALLGILSSMVLHNIATMLRVWPVAGALLLYVKHFLDEEIGTVITIVYWLTYCLSASALASTAADLLAIFHLRDGPTVVIMIIVIVLPVALNSWSLSIFKHLEIVMGTFKLVVALAIILALNVINSEQSPTDELAKRENLFVGGHHQRAGWFGGFMSAILLGSFSLVGIEVVAATAQEAVVYEHQESALTPQTSWIVTDQFSWPARWVPGVVTGLYIWGVWAVTADIPSSDLPLFQPSGNLTGSALGACEASIFIDAACHIDQEHKLAKALTILLMISLNFTATAAVYVASRTLYGFANDMMETKQGFLLKPFYKFCGKKNKYDVPQNAVFVSAWLFWVPFLKFADAETFNQAITLITDMGSVCCILVWACVSFAAMRLYSCYRIYKIDVDIEDDIDSEPMQKHLLVEDNNWYMRNMFISGFAGCACLLVVFLGGSMIVVEVPTALYAVASFGVLGFFVLLVLALKLNRGWQENNLRHCWKLNPVNRLQDFQRRVDSLNVARQKAGVSAELRN